MLRDRGDPAAAQPLFERAVAIGEASYGPDHPNLPSPCSNLGVALRDRGDLAAAQPLLERALAIGETAYGPDHPYVAITLGNLGLVLQDLGGPAEAQQYRQERAVRFKEKTYGPEHPYVAITLGNLGRALQDLGEFAEAPHGARSGPSASRRRPTARNTPRWPLPSATSAGCFRTWGSSPRHGAARCGQYAVEVIYGPHHHYPAITLGYLGDIARLEGNPAEARDYLKRTIPALEHGYGANHVQVAPVLRSLGLVASGQGRHAEARTHLQRAPGHLPRPAGQRAPRNRQDTRAAAEYLCCRPSIGYQNPLSFCHAFRKGLPRHRGRNRGGSQENRRLATGGAQLNSLRNVTCDSTRFPAC